MGKRTHRLASQVVAFIAVVGGVDLARAQPRAEWEDGDPVPPGHHVEQEPRKNLIIGGAAVFGGAWLASVVAGVVVLATSEEPRDADEAGPELGGSLLVPVAGPFIAIATKPTLDGVSTGLDNLSVIGLVVDGVVQVTGLTIAVVGLASPRSVLVRDAPSVSVVPARVGASGHGVAVVGVF